MSRGTFQLISGVETRQRINVVLTKNGKALYTTTTLLPGETYELKDDDRFINSLRAAKVRKPYSDSLKKSLEDANIPYETEQCKSCGGRIKKIVYGIVEVKENDQKT